jgi:hypothetical protein
MALESSVVSVLLDAKVSAVKKVSIQFKDVTVPYTQISQFLSPKSVFSAGSLWTTAGPELNRFKPKLV